MPELTVLARQDVTLLFEWHYYDGPLEGALEWCGVRYWFSADPDHDDFGQVLRLMTLTADDWARVDHSQALFEENVGTHTRYDRVTQRRDLGGIKNCCATYDDPNEGWMPKGDVVATVRMWEDSNA